jgi:hypothetical protein
MSDWNFADQIYTSVDPTVWISLILTLQRTWNVANPSSLACGKDRLDVNIKADGKRLQASQGLIELLSYHKAWFYAPM